MAVAADVTVVAAADGDTSAEAGAVEMADGESAEASDAPEPKVAFR